MYTNHLRHELKPHVYAISATAYRGLSSYGRNQSILVSGESGAGKTETVKILMGHLASISGKKNSAIIDKVLQANPLMESCGNAKTTRNDNSSRFGTPLF
jgi:myosin-5